MATLLLLPIFLVFICASYAQNSSLYINPYIRVKAYQTPASYWRPREDSSIMRIKPQSQRRFEPHQPQNYRRLVPQFSRDIVRQDSRRVGPQSQRRVELQNSRRIGSQNSRRVEMQDDGRVEPQSIRKTGPQPSRRGELQNSRRVGPQYSRRVEPQYSRMVGPQNSRQVGSKVFRRVEPQYSQRVGQQQTSRTLETQYSRSVEPQYPLKPEPSRKVEPQYRVKSGPVEPADRLDSPSGRVQGYQQDERYPTLDELRRSLHLESRDKDSENITEAIDCEVSDWTDWGECDNPCGLGSRRRTRKVKRFPENGGKNCPTLKQRRVCVGKGEAEECLQQSVEYRAEEMQETGRVLPAAYGIFRTSSKYDPWKGILKNLYGRNFNEILSRATYCAHYLITSTRESCNTTAKETRWAKSMTKGSKICVECQPTAMDRDRGLRCIGHGVLNEVTRWSAINVPHCHGEWTMYEKHKPCTCDTDEDPDDDPDSRAGPTKNFIFV